MTKTQNYASLIEQLREALDREEDILFAYLYGSAVYDPNFPSGDIDVAVYLKPTDMKEYIT